MNLPRLLFALCLTLACACGARTGLELVPAPERDAALPFDTFPCSWSWGLPYELDRGAAYVRLQGAVHGTRDEVLVLGQRSTTVVAARLRLTNPPARIAREAVEVGSDVAGLTTGWVSSSLCHLTLRDDDFAAVRPLNIPPPMAANCSFTMVDPRYLDLRVHQGMAFAGLRYDGAGERWLASCVWEPRPGVAGYDPQVVRGPDGRCAAASLEDGLLVVRREDGAEAQLGAATSFALTNDTLRPAALVVRRSGRELRFARVPFAGAATVDELGATSERDDEPLEVVTNETEALVPLAGGRIAIQPLSGSRLRILPPPETSVLIVRLRLVMRPGASLGGALYVVRDGDVFALRFASLSCNR